MTKMEAGITKDTISDFEFHFLCVSDLIGVTNSKFNVKEIQQKLNWTRNSGIHSRGGRSDLFPGRATIITALS